MNKFLLPLIFFVSIILNNINATKEQFDSIVLNTSKEIKETGSLSNENARSFVVV